MSDLKKKMAVAAIVAAFLLGMGCSSLFAVGTDLSNVAWHQPVLGTSYGQPWYGRIFAENSDGYRGTTSSAEARSLLTDGSVGNNNWSYPNTDGGGAWIDLGAVYDIANIEIIPRSSSYWDRLEYATVYGSSLQTTDAEYSFVIPNKNSSHDSHIEAVDRWYGVRWIRIVDETDTIGTDYNLSLSEIRVEASVTAYGSYLGNVSAAATSTYDSPLIYSPNHLVDNQGMNDQNGTIVGYTSAQSDANIGLWRNTNLGTNGFLDQSVTFDLHGSCSLDQIRFWNYNETTWSTSSLAYVDQTDRGIKEALVEYSQDGGATYLPLMDYNGSAAGNYTIAKAQCDSDGSPRQNSAQSAINLANLLADHIRVTVKGNYGDSTYAGLSEVRFYGDRIFPIGDANSDGLVDSRDAAILGSYWGATVTPGDINKGDFNGDGIVNLLDASILAANWTNSSNESGSSCTVPEPSAVVLLVMMTFGIALIRRR